MDAQLIQLSFTSHYYTQLPPEIELEQRYLLDRDHERSSEFRDQFCSDPFGYMIALHEGHVIGRVRLYQRDIVHDGIHILLGGIGFVATIPEYRQRGVASSLLQLGMERLASEGCEAGFLCARLEDSHKVQLYGRFGFVPLGKDYIFSGRSGNLYVKRNGMIAPVTSREKFNRILASPDPLDLGLGNW